MSQLNCSERRCTPEELKAAGAGEVALSLEIEPGVEIAEVSVEITGNGNPALHRSIPVEALGSTVSAFLGVLPVGVDYSLTLEAVSVDEQVTCEGTELFDIVAGQTTFVSVTLNCRSVNEDTGGVIIGGGFNTCPVITGFLVTPLEVSVGNDVNLFSAAYDANNHVLTFDWSATAGVVDESESPSTAYTCTVPGVQVITLTVSDGRCDDIATAEVECTTSCGNGALDGLEECDDDNTQSGDGCSAICEAEICGNLRLDSGEECDDGDITPGDGCGPACELEVCANNRVDFGEECDDGDTTAGDGCDESCLVEECGNARADYAEQCDDGNVLAGDGCDPECFIEACGNSRLNVGEQCDDGNVATGDGCDAQCFIEACGNSRLNVGEQCDDGNQIAGDGCDPECFVEACGNGRADIGEECDDLNTTPGDGCDNLCRIEECGNSRVDAGEECDDGNTSSGDGCDAQCEEEDLCLACSSGPCATFLADCNTALCQNAAACVQNSGCYGTNLVDCYCGPGVNSFTCIGMPQGACAAQFKAAALTTNNSTAYQRLANRSYPSGDAWHLLTCQKGNCNAQCF